MFARVRPVYLYLIFIGFVMISRIFEELGIALLQYLFVAAGFFFFVLAVKRYFEK